MAKVTGPLHSDEASGTIGKTLTFGRGRGVRYVRGRVVPSNPQTPGQLRARLTMRVVGTAVTRMNENSVGKEQGATMTPKEYYQSIVTAPDVWNNLHMRNGYPGGYAALQADSNTFLALTPEQQAAWGTWNTAFVKPFEDVQPITPNPEVPGYSGTIVAFSFAAALFRTGYLATFDTTTPPTWDNTPPVARNMQEHKAVILGADIKPAEDKKKP